jgi:hypothetical protein
LLLSFRRPTGLAAYILYYSLIRYLPSLFFSQLTILSNHTSERLSFAGTLDSPSRRFNPSSPAGQFRLSLSHILYYLPSMIAMSSPMNQMNTAAQVAPTNYTPIGDAMSRHDYGVHKNKKSSTGGGRAWNEEEV